MRKREKESLFRKQAVADAERVAKLICPFCKNGVGRVGTVHLLEISPGAITGGWVQCLAKEVLEGVALHVYKKEPE